MRPVLALQLSTADVPPDSQEIDFLSWGDQGHTAGRVEHGKMLARQHKSEAGARSLWTR
jgi:hypothetical protein